MPKIPTKAKAKVTPKKVQPKKDQPLSLEERLAIAAERETLWVKDLIRYPELLTKHKLPPEIREGMAHMAHDLHRERIRALIAKCSRLVSKPSAVPAKIKVR